MSEPTYRIDVTHEPDPRFPNVPWTARVTRLSDGEQIAARSAGSKPEAIAAARESIAAALTPVEPPEAIFTSEDGQIMDAPEPQSLRA
jgi:hypothetical protein